MWQLQICAGLSQPTAPPPLHLPLPPMPLGQLLASNIICDMSPVFGSLCSILSIHRASLFFFFWMGSVTNCACQQGQGLQVECRGMGGGEITLCDIGHCELKWQ